VKTAVSNINFKNEKKEVEEIKLHIDLPKFEEQKRPLKVPMLNLGSISNYTSTSSSNTGGNKYNLNKELEIMERLKVLNNQAFSCTITNQSA
jgi:hypothetical protein